MKKSTTGLLLGSALVVGLSGCASSASQSSGMGDSASSDRAWYQHPAVCGLAGGLIGGGIGYASSSESDEDTGAALGGTAGATIGALLCAEPNKAAEPAPRDTDGDGVIDANDQCPGTPAGVAVDAVGCPLDSDGDGVPDYQDQCPGTPAGAEVNALGCVEDLVLRDVNFEFDSATLTMGAEGILDDVADKLVANENVRVRIEGHTDAVGSAAYNQDLSQRRADSVADYLASQGVDRNRMRTIGYGESQPVASNETDAGRAENRRVELGEWE
ncbi:MULTISPECIES: OmpA family protein [Halomonas]|nr:MULTISPECIES: OmpA family protein [Halomonas]MDR5888312.1 OmpA family protein [Halomonas salina]PSJ23551.1 flagellar motor protein MotB [Halomonas sp. ND22Bw]RAH36717.1 OmpA family protein [Halomonas sp. SL1]WJY08824.1 OmpA family protein [Halomonas halophila]